MLLYLEAVRMQRSISIKVIHYAIARRLPLAAVIGRVRLTYNQQKSVPSVAADIPFLAYPGRRRADDRRPPLRHSHDGRVQYLMQVVQFGDRPKTFIAVYA